MAKGISDASAIILNEDAVRRIKNTATQTKMNRTQRIENMKDAFEWTQPNDLTGKHLLLVDDVITTGATIERSAPEILKNCNCRISIASIAYAA